MDQESFLSSEPVLSYSRNSLHFMEPKGSLLHLQVVAICPSPEPDESNPCPPSHVLKIHIDIILPSMPGSSKWAPSLIFPHQNPVYTYPLLHVCYMPCPSHSSRFDHLNNNWWGVEIIKFSVCSFLCIDFWFVKVVPKCLNSSTLSKEQLSFFVLWLCPVLWFWDMTMYMILSSFMSSAASH